jgi:NAD(P)-dependent dehydrogenase (short-subunit alcohol dehydrogenase family)
LFSVKKIFFLEVKMINNQLSVLVTGASTGIGLASAQYLAAKGMHVFAGARKQEALADLAKNSNITPLKLDVTNTEDIQQAKKIIEEKTAGLFGLINNAGIGKAGPLMDVSVEDLRAQFEVNLFGVHQITQAMFPLLLKAKGRIVMMSSDSGFFATPFFGPYCSSKFALEGYADSLRREIIPYGLKVIIIEPGRVATPIWDKGEKYLNKYDSSLFAVEAKAIGEYAIRKGKTTGLAPIEVAKTVYKVLTAASPKLRYIVAQNKFEYQMMKILPASYVDKLTLKKVQKVVKLYQSAADHSK